MSGLAVSEAHHKTGLLLSLLLIFQIKLFATGQRTSYLN